MSKQWMLTAIKQRLEQLNKEYRSYFDLNGPSKTYSGAGCMRSRIKKDIGVLKIMECMLLACPDTFTLPDNEELQKVFDRLVKY